VDRKTPHGETLHQKRENTNIIRESKYPKGENTNIIRENIALFRENTSRN